MRGGKSMRSGGGKGKGSGRGGGGRGAGYGPGASSGSESGKGVSAETLTWLDPTKLVFHWDGRPGPIRLTIEGDRSVLGVHACQAFPLSSPNQLVQLFAGGLQGDVGIIENLGALAISGRAAIDECLRRDRMLPEVSLIVSAEERRHIVHWVVATDRGRTHFEMDKVYENVRRQPAGDVVLTDIVGNRYHVYPSDLDAPSLEILERYS
jgi:Domain of unknown function (DUF1854)